ncbi:alpha/beta fold hydrolase [Antrihabitans sp. NCIMB 15449]|uniref:Alpha/beta fold hydrolase n=1 Tax=Antrihabitans spumae TaxID=3373370 RepID=A0ABW7JKK2_9NOCA
MDAEQGTVTSQDGTTIAYELSGQGPVIVLVAAALSDRSDTTKLAKLLSANFTVINYDRRGRGKSADTKPYSPQREIEDIAALIAAGGGSAALFGSSSGAVLCLDAATSLDNTVTKVALFEPPLILDDSRPPVGDAFTQAVTEALNAGNASKAVKLFMGKALGVHHDALYARLVQDGRNGCNAALRPEYRARSPRWQAIADRPLEGECAYAHSYGPEEREILPRALTPDVGHGDIWLRGQVEVTDEAVFV